VDIVDVCACFCQRAHAFTQRSVECIEREIRCIRVDDDALLTQDATGRRAARTVTLFTLLVLSFSSSRACARYLSYF